MLEKVNGAQVSAENLGIPASEFINDSSNYYARNIWDLAAVDGKVLVGFGDYGDNTGSAYGGTPVPYYTNNSTQKQTSSYTGDKASTKGLNTEAVQRFVELDGTIYALSTDALNMENCSYYKYDSEGNRWVTYYKLPSGINCYDMVEFDNKIFFGVMVGTPEYMDCIAACIQYLDKNNFETSSNATNVYFYNSSGVQLKGGKYNDQWTSFYWRVYDMFVYNNNLYAIHHRSSSNGYEGLYKYDKENCRFVQVQSGVSGSLLSVVKTRDTYGLEKIACEPILQNKFEADGKLIAIFNGIYRSTNTNLTNFEKLSLGSEYTNYCVRDAFELDGKYYLLASLMNSSSSFTTVVLETDEKFNSFRKVLSLNTEAFARSFVYNDGYLYIGLGGYPSSSTVGANTKTGTLLRVNINNYVQ